MVLKFIDRYDDSYAANTETHMTADDLITNQCSSLA